MSRNLLSVFHWTVSLFLLGVNLITSYIVRTNDIFFVPNYNPLGFQFGVLPSLIFVSSIAFVLWYFKLLAKYPVFCILILSGSFANYIEKWILFGSVTDYISIKISHFNLADAQIVVGLIGLNILVWLPPSNKKSTIEAIEIG